ncbi:hypothetical protein [Nonomuraea endophytica]|uniref:Putative RNase H-like nuclease (RuvC/YqgF family) n=1 Tax=Nonomuraea endophytica TaxID=714136 RepID=A0A7W8EDB0_9ACTN|nr:hypothetical protein [Nonomuraea endophytica]MBB5076375.1 putative RNase H-like nuclease (RuvC/YqgF family) [Nonomuraea endophytica]
MTSAYFEELEALLDDAESEDFDERTRRPPATVRTPPRQSSFVQRSAPSAASQSQVQAAARNLDSKIETLSTAVRALETRTDALTTAQDRQTALLRREVAGRRKAADGLRTDLQQTKMLAVLLPMLTQQAVESTDDNGRPVRVLTQSQNPLTMILPLLLLTQPPSGADGNKGAFGDPTMLILLLTAFNR